MEEATTEDQVRLAELAAAIKEGDDDFERGDVLEHAEVVALFADVLKLKEETASEGGLFNL